MRAMFLVLVSGLLAAPAAAQDSTFGESHFVDDTRVDVVVQWRAARGRPHGRVEVRAGGQSRQLHDGAPAYAWSAGGARGVITALVGASETVEVVHVPIDGGRPGEPRRTALRRLATGDRAPVGAAVTARPDGFAVFWQEASTSTPSALYETYLARFDLDGRVVGETTAVQARWPIADVAWLSGAGQYYFLLYYGGSNPSGTRLCGVHIAGTPLRNTEHPFWASRAGMIDEARLVVHGGSRVTAVYRDDGELFEEDVTTGRWGAEPSRPRRSHGRIAADESYGMQVTGNRVAIRRVRVGRTDE